MNNLNLMPMTKEGKVEYVVDSREVAEMLGKDHKKLLRDIKVYMEYLAESNFGPGNFFIESNYKDLNNQKRPCYLLTKQGCEMVANKMTGKKGILFTATYVQAFNDMEQALKGNVSSASAMLGTLKRLEQMQSDIKDMEWKMLGLRAWNEDLNEGLLTLQEEVDEKFEKLEMIYKVVNNSEWRENTDNLLKFTARSLGNIKCIGMLRREVYDLMEKRLGINLNDRIARKGKRMALEGVCKSKIDKINPMTIITEDKRLIDSYVSAVRDVCASFINGVDSIDKKLG